MSLKQRDCTYVQSSSVYNYIPLIMFVWEDLFLFLFDGNAVWFVVLFTKCWANSLASIYSVWDSQVVPVQIV